MEKSYDNRKRKPSNGHKKDQRSQPFRRNVVRKPKESVPQKKSNPDEIRLNRYIANAGICSRREADTYIAAGNVTVNGKPVTEMGYKVKRSDDVRFDG